MEEVVPQRSSISRRLSLIVGGALVAAVLVVGGMALLEQRRQLTRALETKATSLAQFMAQVSPISVLSLNFVDMNNNVKKVVLTDDEAVYAVIVNEQRIPLAYYFKDSDATITDEIRGHVAARNPLAAIETIKKSAPVLEIEAPIHAADKRIGYAAIGFSLDNMHRALVVQIVLIGAILIVVTSACLLLLGLALRRILQPVKTLTSAALQISAGDLNVTLQGTERTDELGVLSRAFQSMAGQLRDLVARMSERMAELQRVGNALQKSEEEFRRIVATASEGILVLNKDGMITFVNPRMAEILGSTPALMMGRPLTEFMFREDLPDHEKKMECRVRGISENYERRFRRSDGQTLWTHVSATPIMDAEGRYNGSFGMFTDITDRKQAEDEIRRFNQQLEKRVAERTEQLEAANQELEAFAYSVSHDLRAPLRAIDGYSHILLEDYPDKLDDEGKRLLNSVRTSAERMAQLIEDILEFSRAGRTELASAPIDMERLAREVLADLAPADKVKVEIGALPPAKGDRAMLRQVLVNLLSNAIKFTRPRETPLISIQATIDGDDVVYCVTDNGVGFDEAQVDKLFGVFQRLHRPSEFEGSGIGLAIVKRIVNRHGGKVSATGKVDEGAAIRFTLPHA